MNTFTVMYHHVLLKCVHQQVNCNEGQLFTKHIFYVYYFIREGSKFCNPSYNVDSKPHQSVFTKFLRLNVSSKLKPEEIYCWLLVLIKFEIKKMAAVYLLLGTNKIYLAVVSLRKILRLKFRRKLKMQIQAKISFQKTSKIEIVTTTIWTSITTYVITQDMYGECGTWAIKLLGRGTRTDVDVTHCTIIFLPLDRMIGGGV